MRKIVKALACLLSCLTATATMQAQYTYIPNTVQETAFAKAEYTALGTRPTPINVPHLSPAAVPFAMANSRYFGYNSSNASAFTFVIAHRGSHTAPGCAENSACSIAAAYEAGADAIELDIKITADGAPVLGHDVSVARELNNWTDENGSPVTRNSAWTPFIKFPVLDYVYQDLTKYPFLNNFRLSNPNGGYQVDPNNPTRTTMNLNNIQNGVLVDTYNQPTTNHQLTLYEALYLIQQYYRMSIWLDVKSVSDLKQIASSITAARNTMPDPSGLLKNISLKLDWSTLSDSTVNGNPGALLGLSGISYFLVMGTGNLDQMAVYNGQPAPPLPDPGGQGLQQIQNSVSIVCTAANGCLGVELGHKYIGAPTQGVYNFLSSINAIAAFQTLPQYAWYWQTLATQKEQSTTYGRTFPRTDGSCCFAPSDTFNISKYFGYETQDLRTLYSWNETAFSTITTDEPLTVLRDLTDRGKRPTAVAQTIGGINTNIPSGGSGAEAGVFPDGLYYIQVTSVSGLNGWNISVTGAGSSASLNIVAPQQQMPQQMWYLSSKQSGYYTLTNAATGQSIALNSNGGLSLGTLNNTKGYLWNYSDNSSSTPYAGNFQAVSTSLNLNIYETSVVARQETAIWALIPVSTPSSETAQQQRGPAGYTYCSDENQTCNFSGPGSVAFGANGSFRYLQYTSGPISCQRSSFNNIDPAPGTVKACFYAPYDPTWTLPANFVAGPAEWGTNTIKQAAAYAFGAIDPNTGAALYTYKTFSAPNYPYSFTCSYNEFGYDPAPGVAKQCWAVTTTSVPPAPAGFTYCASENSTCPFSGTAAIAFGTVDSKTGATRYTYKTFANGVKCVSESFGLDPFYGTAKGCFYRAATPLGSVTSPVLPIVSVPCATAGGTCSNLPIGALVAFGGTYNGQQSYAFTTVSNAALASSFPCSVSTFGGIDPAPGSTEGCYQLGQDFVNRGPTGFTFCSVEGGTCQFNGVAQIAFGVDGRYNIQQMTQTNGVSCANEVLSQPPFSDPDPSVVKACYYRLY